jgi:hypothetical protein
MSKTLSQITADVVQVFNEYDSQGTRHWSYKEAMADLPYQLGSLAKRMGQLDGMRYADGLSREQLLKHTADELADIIAESLFIAYELGIDMDTAFVAMFASDRKKIAERTASTS